MAKKKSDRQLPPSPLPSVPPLPANYRSPDKLMADLQRLLSEQNFDSIEEVDQFMQQLMASGGYIPEAAPNTALEKAQEVMYKAWETRSRTQRLKLARKALEISPDCADAYVLLAEESAKTPEEARALYEQGVSAGERALKDDFDDMKGEFWGFIETRPYMRARLGLAEVLWALGERDAAAAHMAAMLELNPNDNQGVRYLYVNLLLELKDDERLEKLFRKYKNDWSACWKYSLALHEFRKKGNSRKAVKLLDEAIAFNPFVPDYLLGKKKLPKQMPPYYSPGDSTEAIEYLLEGMRPWVETEGALDWLKQFVEGDKGR